MARLLTPPCDVIIRKHEVFLDERGSWSRFFDSELDLGSVELGFSQISISENPQKGTLRGLHFQVSPSSEFKCVSCIEGRIFDVIVNIQPESGLYLDWYGLELSQENELTIVIPPGYAHGFITLEKNSKVLYAMDKPFDASAYFGLAWNDPKIGIAWPMNPLLISSKDSTLSFLT